MIDLQKHLKEKEFHYVQVTEDFKVMSEKVTKETFFVKPTGTNICIRRPQRVDKIGSIIVNASRASQNNFAEILSIGDDLAGKGIEVGDFAIVPLTPVQFVDKEGDHQVKAGLRLLTETLPPHVYEYEDVDGSTKVIEFFFIPYYELEGVIRGTTADGKKLKRYMYHMGN